jgi:nucleoside-diphosphate-sugar epimerase
MKVLVSGAGGFLGRYVVDRLLRGGHSVRAIVRPASPKPSWAGAVEVFYADLRVHDNLVAAFEDIDAVLHVAAATSGNEDVQFASTVVATERFLDAMSHSAVKRLVLVSSLVVYDWTCAKGRMDETTPLLRDPYDMGAYTIAKVWQERVVSGVARSHGWSLTIMRPGFIWGPGHAEIAGMGRRFGRLQLMFGPFSRLPLSHVVNCADALVAAIESPTSAGETFNVIDADDIRVWRYAREYARRSARGGIPLPLPYGVGLGVARCAALVSRMLFGKKGKLPSLLTPRRFQQQFKPLRFSNKLLREKLAWAPPLRFDECLARTYAPEKSAE